ncbi:MAG: CvpA family protein [Candidatus Omnitrophota bacterium]
MNVIDILKHINWVDILVLVIAIRFVYVSIQTGFVVEFLKLLAVFAALMVSLHFYTHLSGTVKLTFFSQGTWAVTAFVFLWLITLLVCKLIRDGLLMLFSVNAQGPIDRWGAALFSIGRIILTASMLMFAFLVSGQKYFQKMTLSSMSGERLLLVAPVLYRESCDRVVTRLFPEQKKNPAVGKTLQDAVKK